MPAVTALEYAYLIPATKDQHDERNFARSVAPNESATPINPTTPITITTMISMREYPDWDFAAAMTNPRRYLVSPTRTSSSVPSCMSGPVE